MAVSRAGFTLVLTRPVIHRLAYFAKSVSCQHFLPCAEMALIDIPIGLRGWRRDGRLCDKQARAVLLANKKPCFADSSFYSRLIATQRLWCQANQNLISII